MFKKKNREMNVCFWTVMKTFILKVVFSPEVLAKTALVKQDHSNVRF